MTPWENRALTPWECLIRHLWAGGKLARVCVRCGHAEPKRCPAQDKLSGEPKA